MQQPFDFNELSKRWQQQPTQPLAADLSAARRQQGQKRWQFIAELATSAMMVLVAIWLLLSTPFWLGLLSAVFLLFGALSLTLTSLKLHRPLMHYNNWSSRGLLQFRLQNCRALVRYLRYNQYSCLAILLFVAGLWLLEWWQPQQVSALVLQIYSWLAWPLCGLGWWQLGRKRQQALTKLQNLQQLYDEFSEAEETE